MDRLTKQFTDGTYYCEEVEDVGIEGINAPTYVGKAVNKLAEYEDAEEQGLLHKTQVAIGSIVYRINEYAEEPLIPMGVISIEIKGITDTFKEMKCKECVYGGEFTYRFSDIGKTVFLTKEAAKQALEAMKGGGEC